MVGFRLIAGTHKSYLELTCEYGTHISPNREVRGTKDHCKNCRDVRPLLLNIFCVIVYFLNGFYLISDTALCLGDYNVKTCETYFRNMVNTSEIISK